MVRFFKLIVFGGLLKVEAPAAASTTAFAIAITFAIAKVYLKSATFCL